MHRGNKSPQAEAAGSFWEQCRTLLVFGHATALSRCCPHLLLLLLRTLPTGRKAQDAFLSEGRKQHWRWGGFPRASWDAAHPQEHPLLHPKDTANAAIPPWLIIQEINLWLVFQGSEEQQWHGTVLRAPPTQGINPAIWDDLSAPLRARLPPARSAWGLISWTRRQVFTPGKYENMYCKQIINPIKYVFCILSICLLNRIVKIWTKPPKTNLNPKFTGSCILTVATDFADFVFWFPLFTHTPSQPGHIFRQKTAPAGASFKGSHHKFPLAS